MNQDSIIPTTDRYTIYLDAAYELAEGFELYTELLYNKRKTYFDASGQIWQFGVGQIQRRLLPEQRKSIRSPMASADRQRSARPVSSTGTTVRRKSITIARLSACAATSRPTGPMTSTASIRCPKPATPTSAS
jgi:hypothetical protein